MSKPKRPRLRGARHKYEPFNLTDYISKLHAASSMLKIQPETKGAYGGCLRIKRAKRDVIKRSNPVNSPIQ